MIELMKKKRFGLLSLIILVGTFVTSTLLLVLPFNFKPKESNETIAAEIMSRIEDIAEQRDQLSFISFTPFMWDEGYYFDNTTSKDMINQISTRAIEFKQLSEEEQRLVFFYKGQLIVDLVVDKCEVNFDILPSQLQKDEWLNIDNNSDVIRLY